MLAKLHLLSEAPPPAGAYWVGGVGVGVAFNVQHRPWWLHRFMMRMCFGWVWVDNR